MKQFLFALVSLFISSSLYISADVKEVFLYFDQNEWEHIYENWDQEIYIPCTIKYLDQEWTDCEMRIRGDGSKKYPRKSMKVVFNGKLFYDGKKKLNLNAEYLDKSRIHSFLASYIFQKSGAPTFTTEYYRVYMNDEFAGVYLSIENIDNLFLEANNLSSHDNLYKATKDDASLNIDYPIHLWEKKTNKDKNWNDLKELMVDLNNYEGDNFYNYVKNNMDYDNMINYMALTILLSHGSTYNHNYYMYHDLSENRWKMIAWDMDKTFSQYSVGYIYRMNHGNNSDNPLFLKSLTDDRIFTDIKTRMIDLNNTIFNLDYLSPVIDSLYTVLKPSVLQDTLFHFENENDWYINIQREKEFIERRYDVVNQMFKELPSLFTISRSDSIEFGPVDISWTKSHNYTDEGEIRYEVSVSTKREFPDDKTEIYTDIADTIFTIESMPESGSSFYKIEAYNTKTGKRIFGTNKLNRFNYQPDATVVTGNIDKDITLTKDKSPYVLFEALEVNENAKLIIEPGVELYIAKKDGHNIRGSFIAKGTNSNPIKIYSKFDRSICKLTFNSCPELKLDHVKTKNLFLRTNNTDTKISNSSFYYTSFMNKEYGADGESPVYYMSIDCHGNENKIEINNISFFGNSQIEGCMVTGNNQALVTNSTFENLADAIEFNDIQANTYVEGNTVIDCFDDAFDCNRSKGIEVSHNRIFNIKDKAFSIDASTAGEDGYFKIHHNVVDKAKLGMGIKNNAKCDVYNNTFCNCKLPLRLYQKEESEKTIPPTINANNNIFYNSSKVVEYHDNSDGKIAYSLSNEIQIEGEGNIQGKPMFENVKLENYKIKPGSPCIDAGNPNFDKDPDNTRADIGAFYFHQSQSFTENTIVINEINYNSADDNDTGDWVELYINTNLIDDLEDYYISDNDDNHIFKLPKIGIEKGDYVVVYQDKDLFRDAYKNVNPAVGEMDFGFSGKKDIVRLYDDKSTLIDWVEYTDDLPWDTLADGHGATLELINPDLDNSLPESWRASLDLLGTPGRRNTVFDPAYTRSDTTDPVKPPVKAKIQFNIFPNPCTDIINLTCDSVNISVKYQIFNSKGQIFLEQNETQINQTFTINTELLESGAYYLYIAVDNRKYLYPFLKQD